MTSEGGKIQEKDLYGPISKELEGNSNTCYTMTIEQYPLSINEEKRSRRVDIIAAKWPKESNLEVAAVECKLGQGWKKVEDAIGQAITYQTFVPYVYIATETPKERLGHMENVLRELGLGYIHVKMDSKERGKASIVLRPKKSAIIKNSRMMNQVLHPLGHLLIWREYWGEDAVVYGAGEEQSRFWIGAHKRRKCNYLTQFHPDGKIVQGINFESQTYLREFFTRANMNGFLEVLRNLPQDAIMSQYHFKPLRDDIKTQISKPTFDKKTPHSKIDESAVRSLLKYAKKHNYAIWVLIASESVIPCESPVRSDIEAYVKKLNEEYCPLYEFIINNIYKRPPI